MKRAGTVAVAAGALLLAAWALAPGIVESRMNRVTGASIPVSDRARAIQKIVRHRFADRHARDLGHGVGATLKVLDIDSGIDVDACFQQLHDILITVAMAKAGGVGVGQLVHQNQFRAARQQGVKVHVFEPRSPVVHDLPRQNFHPLQQELSFDAAMRIDVAHDHVHAFAAALAARFQHRVGLPNTCDHAKEDLEFAALLL